MRVTAQTKQATRNRILQAARRLFADNGYDATTTRDIAKEAGIASGTLFNYFPTKEAVVGCLASEAIGDALTDAQPAAREAESGLLDVAAVCIHRRADSGSHRSGRWDSSNHRPGFFRPR